MSTSLVTRIQRDSILDRPGCRYVVFTKGCHLDCPWCHNPETQEPRQQIMVYDQFCINCGQCRTAEYSHLSLKNFREKLKGSTEERFFPSVERCPANALEFAAKSYSSEWILRDMIEFRTMYRETGGGLTISGGEPLVNKDFSLDLLSRARAQGFHTAIDTTGALNWNILESALDVVDLWLFDIKHSQDPFLLNDLAFANLGQLVKGKPEFGPGFR